MTDELIKKLLESGVHFGHQTKRWNPKMARFIFGERNKIYIIDLEKTVKHLNRARDFLYSIAMQGGRVLFVGTKKQAQNVIKQEAMRCNMPYVDYRWLGGLLTNFQTVRKSIDRLNSIDEMDKSGVMAKLSKKEVARINKERDKLVRNLIGVREMDKLPQVVFLIDSKREEIAVREANKLGIPVVALIDTNCDPDHIDYPIPGNDDALKSIRLIASLIADTVSEGYKEYLSTGAIKEKAQADKTTEVGSEPEPEDEELESIEKKVEKEEGGKRGPTKVKLDLEKK